MKNKDLSFLLNVVPLAELTDSMSEIVEKYRYSAITEKEAVSSLKDKCGNELGKFVSLNKEIYKECSDFMEIF